MDAIDTSDSARAEPKQDPESLVLRGRPRPAIRFRRGLIIGVAGAIAAGLVGIAWIALDPPSFRMAAQDTPPVEPGRVSEDAVADAPASYGDVPKLGPPLPGDLGGPILDHQAERGDAGLAEPAATAGFENRSGDIERERLASEADAARSSDVLVSLAGRSLAAPTAPLPRPETDRTTGTGSINPAVPPSPDMRVATSVARHAAATAAAEAPSPWMLSAGTIIPASLVTGLNSDLPGLVVAQVTENVRDSATGEIVLVPQGARLIGTYGSASAFGQTRALLSWKRIVFPNGASVDLGGVPATDASGHAGLSDRVDSHEWQLVKGIAYSILLGVGTEVSLGSSESELVRAVRESTQRNAAQAGEQITARNLDVRPTLRVRPGWPVLAIVQSDLILEPWKG